MPGEPTSDSGTVPAPLPDAFEVEARATLFGFEPTAARATVIARSRRWRVGGAARTFGAFAVVAPLVAIFPPHAVWPIGALVAGTLLARRRYVERFTLVALEGTCPKCDGALGAKVGRLREPHPVPCEACHHESSLRIAPELLATRAVE